MSNHKVASQLLSIASNLLKEERVATVVLWEEDLEELSSKAKGAWQGYYYKMTYEVWTPEDVEHGDASDRGWEEEGSNVENSLEEICSTLEYDATWMGWSSSPPDGKNDWIYSQDDEDFSSGDRTQYHAWIMRKDGKALSKEEVKFISKQLRLQG